MNTIILQLSSLTPSAMRELWEGLDGDEYENTRELLAQEYECNTGNSIESPMLYDFHFGLGIVTAYLNSGDFPETWAETLIKDTNYDTAEMMVQAAVAEVNDPASFAKLFLEMFDTIEEPLNVFWKNVAVGMSEYATNKNLHGLYRFAVLCTKLKG